MLKITDIEVYYGNIHALKGVSLDVGQGNIVAVLGANGAGKSTLLRAVSGLLFPVRGEIEFVQQRIDSMSPHRIVRMGISHVPEGRELFPDLTVLENLAMGAYIHKKAKKMADELDVIYGHFPILKERKNQNASSLSGGEQQMLAIGRALMSNPRLLLLDEPSLGLAPRVVEGIYRIIRGINGEGTTILLVEQNAKVALTIAHYGYVFETGKVKVVGRGADLLQNEHVKRAYLGR
ncbi:MAG TPA: ABC transporter ATP-binding protein [Thermodesulfobacteriota bacterium]|nr:ABC transporter ATP-binding protein [Thermodesulfobacteriota bacterium]